MKYPALALALIVTSGVALAQEEAPAENPAGPWEFFADGDRSGASVRAANGAQLVLKCDKPGRREVHALLLATGSDRLAVPNIRAVSRPITFQFDGGSPRTENWGFYEKYAIAQGKTSDRALARFVAGLKGSSNIRLRLDTGISTDVQMVFDVTGAADAVSRVYEKCKDSVPS